MTTLQSELGVPKNKVLFSEHHLSHAASAFLCSPFDEAAILTVDGVGEWVTATYGVGRGNDIRPLKQIEFPHSVGLLYSAFTAFLQRRPGMSRKVEEQEQAPQGESSASHDPAFPAGQLECPKA